MQLKRIITRIDRFFRPSRYRGGVKPTMVGNWKVGDSIYVLHLPKLLGYFHAPNYIDLIRQIEIKKGTIVYISKDATKVIKLKFDDYDGLDFYINNSLCYEHISLINAVFVYIYPMTKQDLTSKVLPYFCGGGRGVVFFSINKTLLVPYIKDFMDAVKANLVLISPSQKTIKDFKQTYRKTLLYLSNL